MIVQVGLGVKKILKFGFNKVMVVEFFVDVYDILVVDLLLVDVVICMLCCFYFFGKVVGQINVFVFGVDGKEFVSLDIQVECDILQFEINLCCFLLDFDIKVEIILDNIVLIGIVCMLQDVVQVFKFVEIFVKGGEVMICNQIVFGIGLVLSVVIFVEDCQQLQIVNLFIIQGEDQVMFKVIVVEVS